MNVQLHREFARPTVMLTGASGVVGQAVLRRLRDVDVICLVHRAPIENAAVTSIRGDVRAARFGWSDADYDRAVASVDAVIHCAAVTDFNRTDGTLEQTNIGGTEVVVEFAAAANAT